VREAELTETLQVALVVRDLEATMRTYVERYGIGPWHVYEFNPDTVQNMRENGEPVARSWRLALARVGEVQWELIQPLDGESIYARHLAEHGESVHHLGVAVPSYEAALAREGEHGRQPLLAGEYNGIEFAYLATDGDLGVVTEVFSGAPGDDQVPDAVYPPSA
jgi:methylmalonyl-CoA/ethylmalonyl-CoA epimerase